jgi:hypothetical protein
MEVVGYLTLTLAAFPGGRVGSAPLITGWFNTIMVQSGTLCWLANQQLYLIYGDRTSRWKWLVTLTLAACPGVG